MTKYRGQLPQLSGDLFITDGGIETTLIFLEGLNLPSFAAFVLLESDQGSRALKSYFRRYADLARKYAAGFILESPTGRASSDWAANLGYTEEALADFNRKAIELLVGIRNEYETDENEGCDQRVRRAARRWPTRRRQECPRRLRGATTASRLRFFVTRMPT